MSSTWDIEYGRGGIPSSVRQEPSGVLLWALDNWMRLTGEEHPNDVIDIGCGTGRNATHLALLGANVIGFDSSEVAIETATSQTSLRPIPNLRFLKQDLALGVPATDASLDFAVDIFVYKHQVDPQVRHTYRRELRRVLRREGRLLLSLAGLDDGYYANCPSLSVTGNPLTVVDTVANIQSVLFSLDDLIKEFAGTFSLEMSWHKSKRGLMHGSLYERSTVATIWRPHV